jgi:hypothetical protein
MFLRLAQADWAEHRKFLAKNYSCRKKNYNPNAIFPSLSDQAPPQIAELEN